MKKEKKQRKPKYKLRLALLYIGSFIVNILPLCILFALNWDRYVTRPADTVKLCLGGALTAAFILLAVLGKLKLPKKAVTLSILLVMCYLLGSVLPDLMIIIFMALCGELLDLILFRGAIKRTREDILIGRTADATSKQVEDALAKYFSNGRT